MSKTYEEIKQRVLNNTDINVDKREGSFLNDMASPLSYELAKFYIEQQDLVNMAFVKNGYFNYLDIKCEEYGISRKQGIKSVGEVIFTGENGTLISNGTMLVVDDLYFVVLCHRGVAPVPPWAFWKKLNQKLYLLHTIPFI